MLLIPIKYLEEGKNELDVVAKPYEIELPKEFGSDIIIGVVVDKFGWQLKISAEVETKLDLVCDYTLEDFKENLKITVNIICKLDNLSIEEKAIYAELDNFIFYKQDDNNIDIGDMIREELLLAIPMKRISPNYRNKDFVELYPEYSAESSINSEEKPNPFAVLKNMNIDKN